MNGEDYRKWLRLAAGGVSLFFAGMSVYFSANFFGFNMGDGDVVYLFGVGLAVAINILEFIFNSESDRMGMVPKVAALLAYAYGIASNVLGIHSYHEGASPTIWIFDSLLGVMLEVLPEPLLLWSLTGRWTGGDLFSNLFAQRSAESGRDAHVMSPPPAGRERYTVQGRHRGNGQE